jgi:hypothetical protein
MESGTLGRELFKDGPDDCSEGSPKDCPDDASEGFLVLADRREAFISCRLAALLCSLSSWASCV